jgi:zinc transport system substrate-binding protein
VVGQIKDHGVKTVLAEELYGKDMGDTIERETDAKVYYLDTMVRGKYEADSYLNAMKKNIQILKEAFAQ